MSVRGSIIVFRGIAVFLMLVCLMGCMQGRDSDPYAKPDAEISAPHRLLVEGASSPLGVGRDVPRLSWRSAVDRQHAYEIEVASSAETLLDGNPDLWASGRVVDGRSAAVPYRGKTLKSAQNAVWRVRVWQEGEARPFLLPPGRRGLKLG